LIILTQNIDTKLDNRLTLKFIETLGIYPLGSVVSLKNGEMFKVLSFDKKNGYSVVSNVSVKENEQTPIPIVIQSDEVKQLLFVKTPY
ncbi:MAG: hypothetical protein RPR97_17400, partial [Colwellia sp.]